MRCPVCVKAALSAAFVLWAGHSISDAAEPTTIFAAASLREALDTALASYEGEVVVSYAGSSALARQIEAGAPANIFISANTAWMDALEANGAIIAASRTDLLGNRLALVAYPTDGVSGAFAPVQLTGDTVLEVVGDSYLAMALVDAVPAGIYGKEALAALGVWQGVAPNIVQTDNVRSALALVARGEAPFGIVYTTDAPLAPNLSLLGVFPETSHTPIVYPAALVTGEDTPAAIDLFGYLFSAAAQDSFMEAGFIPPAR